jgi:hypothetical protein
MQDACRKALDEILLFFFFFLLFLFLFLVLIYLYFFAYSFSELGITLTRLPSEVVVWAGRVGVQVLAAPVARHLQKKGSATR